MDQGEEVDQVGEDDQDDIRRVDHDADIELAFKGCIRLLVGPNHLIYTALHCTALDCIVR